MALCSLQEDTYLVDGLTGNDTLTVMLLTPRIRQVQALVQVISQSPYLPTPERHEFILHNFHTESGAILPEAHIVYGTYGTLNADRSNAILLPSPSNTLQTPRQPPA